MKTRTLLLLAVACAFVILVAGSIKLFLVAEEDPPEHLAVGATGTAGDMRVTVLDASVRDGQLLVNVRIGGVDDRNGAESFEFRNGRESLQPVQPRSTGAGGEAACAATSTADAECLVAFDTTDARGLLLYSRTSDDVLRWDISEGAAG